MTFEEISTWFSKNFGTIIVIILFLLMEAPNYFEKMGWYSKKIVAAKEKAKQERKKEYDENTQEFIQKFVPPIVDGINCRFQSLEKNFVEVKDQLDGLMEADKDLMRNEMKEIFYKFRQYKKIPEYEMQTFLKLFEAYKNFKGNLFIDDIKQEMDGWEITESIDDIIRRPQ